MDYSTFAGLQSAVRSELDRTDTTDAQINSFIRITERRAYRGLRIPSMEVKIALPVLPGAPGESDSVPYVEVPSDWIETITLTDEGGRGVEYITQQKFRQLNHESYSDLMFFTREGQKFLLWPTTGNQEVFLYYYAKPDAGDADANPAPPIYADIGEALFYGAVGEGWRFHRDNDKAAYYRALFSETLELLMRQHKQSDVSGSTMITKNPYL